MVYSRPVGTEAPFPAKGLREAYSIGVKVIVGVFSGVFVISELQRIGRLPFNAVNDVYLGLLVATLLLVGGWIVFLKMDLDAVATWLDPVAYEPPNETLVSVGLAVMLAGLILTARYVVLFGIVYALYATSNLLASRHLRGQAGEAIRKSHERLDADRGHPELADSVAIYDKALGALKRFLLLRPNLPRIAACLCMGGLGLSAAAYSHAARSQSAEVVAYTIYIAALIGPEMAVMMVWRMVFYNELRPLASARRELIRRKTDDVSSNKE